MFKRLWCRIFGHVFVRKIYGEWYLGRRCACCSTPNPSPRSQEILTFLETKED
jgi:hypothetical protein